jgi:type IV pilus assembly protein PilW
MMQMFSMFEEQKRTTTGGDDALNAGIIAMYGMQQEIKNAGYSFANAASAAASSVTMAFNGDPVTPVMINYARIAAIGDVNTDTLVAAYGDNNSAPMSASGVASAANVKVNAFAVINGQLSQCDYVANDCAVKANWNSIAADVVSMKAVCIGAPAIGAPATGVELALITRNAELSKTAVTGAVGTAPAPTWSGAALPGGTAIDLTGRVPPTEDATAIALAARDGNASWQYYRYKVFETLVPIRTAIWTGVIGCI